jgi:hypothetical protein
MNPRNCQSDPISCTEDEKIMHAVFVIRKDLALGDHYAAKKGRAMSDPALVC